MRKPSDESLAWFLFGVLILLAVLVGYGIEPYLPRY